MTSNFLGKLVGSETTNGQNQSMQNGFRINSFRNYKSKAIESTSYLGNLAKSAYIGPSHFVKVPLQIFSILFKVLWPYCENNANEGT